MNLDKNTGRDFEILRAGSICKYFRSEILNKDITWFQNNKFRIVEMNTRKWDRNNVHKNLKTALDFPDYYGENLAAFSDCLGDLYNEKYKGLILVFKHYCQFVKQDKEVAEALLDIISRESRIWLLTGQKLIGLVQTDDPDLEFPQLGGVSPSWNSAEWLNENRRK